MLSPYFLLVGIHLFFAFVVDAAAELGAVLDTEDFSAALIENLRPHQTLASLPNLTRSELERDRYIHPALKTANLTSKLISILSSAFTIVSGTDFPKSTNHPIP